MKLTKLTFECEKDGKKYTRILSGDCVKQWNDWMIFVCQYADEAGVNPPWHDLNWVQTEIKSKNRNKNKFLLSEIIEQRNKE